jgi:hypothetical protein
MFLTPELINLVRINFLGDDLGSLSWVAEADFLLSPLCLPLGGASYCVEPQVRELLLADLMNWYGIEGGNQRINALADFLLAYLDRRVVDRTAPDILRAQRWIAWAIRAPERVVDEMTLLLKPSEPVGSLSEGFTRQVLVATMLEVVRDPLEARINATDFQQLIETSEFLGRYWFRGPARPDVTTAASPNPLLGAVQLELLRQATADDSPEERAAGRQAFEDCDELNALFEESVYSTAKKKKIRSLLRRLGLANSDHSSLAILHRTSGELLRRTKNGRIDILAMGRSDWEGRVELTEKALQLSRNEEGIEDVRRSEVGGARMVYDARNAESMSIRHLRLARKEGDPPSNDRAVNEVYDALGATRAFLKNVLGRNSLDGRGMNITAVVHYGRDYNNAFTHGGHVYIGDGDQKIFNSFAFSREIIAHQLFHVVMSFESTTSALQKGESGALLESICDVFGALVKQYSLNQKVDEADWLVGGDVLAPGFPGAALRSLVEPGRAYDNEIGRDLQPTHMSEYAVMKEDLGGIHVNSGIPNHAFYLIATELGGYAWEAAGMIWYEAIRGRKLGARTTFQSFARLTSRAAERLYGKDTREVQAVLNGWRAVGITWSDRTRRNSRTTRRQGVDDWAIVVGVDHHSGAASVSGALAFGRWLEQPSGGNLPSSQIMLLTSSDDMMSAGRNNTTNAAELERRIYGVFDQGVKWGNQIGRRLYLYFSGTARFRGDDPTLLLSNGTANVIQGVNLRLYAEQIRTSGIFDEIVLIADCESGRTRRPIEERPLYAPTFARARLARYLFIIGQYSGKVEVRKGHLPELTRIVIEGLQGAAGNSTGKVTDQSLGRFVTKRVRPPSRLSFRTSGGLELLAAGQGSAAAARAD